MKKALPLLFATSILVLIFIVMSIYYAPEQGNRLLSLGPVSPPKPAPTLNLLAFDEINDYTSDDLQGQVTIINFWATWCPPCRKEFPSMNRAWKTLQKEGVLMLAINVGEERDMVKEFIEQYPIDFTVLLDEDGVTSQDWNIRGMPESYILNSKGEIVYNFIGDRNWDDKEILNAIRNVK